jgi:hypothetical protein
MIVIIYSHPPLSPFPWEGKGEEKERGASAPLGLPYKKVVSKNVCKKSNRMGRVNVLVLTIGTDGDRLQSIKGNSKNGS